MPIGVLTAPFVGVYGPRPYVPSARKPEAPERDLIERQAEEIERLQAWSQKRGDDLITLGYDIARLIAERAELIEALRPFSREEISGFILADFHRARALLERLGEK